MLEIGSLVDNKYKILSEIGRGGMSVVYMAINEKANKTWAIKEIRKDGQLEFEAVKQGLIVETDMLKKLKHSNLPSIIDVIEDENSFLIVMDYIEGNSLKVALEEYGAQSQENVIEWAKQLSDVLGYLHSREPAIIYRDMKPANVMLKPDGNLTVVDFGTAREFKEKNLADTICLGTVGYAAPEQYGNMGQTDARTDIYCLGATLYHLVTGYNPCEPPYEIKPIREVNQSLSSGLERIILKCTQRNPDDRYQSAAELLYALEHYEEIDDQYKKKQKRRLGLFIASIIASVLFVLSGFTFRVAATKKASDIYNNRIDEAKKTSDHNTKIKIYEEALSIPEKAGEREAYIGLIESYKEILDGENTVVFTQEEAKSLETFIKNNRNELRKQIDNYVEICFETGKLFWYYYSYGDGNQITRAKSAIEWFQVVIENAPADFENIGMAKAYANIGMFYRDIQTNVVEANDRGKYKPLYTNLMSLLETVASNQTEREVVKLELLELSRSALQQYATKFKMDGVSEEDITNMHETIVEILENINVSDSEVLNKKKTAIIDLLETTKESIEIAYGTREGGN